MGHYHNYPLPKITLVQPIECFPFLSETEFLTSLRLHRDLGLCKDIFYRAGNTCSETMRETMCVVQSLAFTRAFTNVESNLVGRLATGLPNLCSQDMYPARGAMYVVKTFPKQLKMVHSEFINDVGNMYKHTPQRTLRPCSPV